MREQISRFMYAKYKVKLNYQLYANKQLHKKSRYSEITFPADKNTPVEVDVEFDTVLKGNRQKLLDISFRCAVRMALWYSGYPFKEGHPKVLEEYSKYGLKDYKGMPEMGLDLHTYQCSECKKIWFLKEKKIPKSKDPVIRGYVTSCCRKPFEYNGLNHYDSDQLYKAFNALNNEKKGYKHGLMKSPQEKTNSFDLW